MKEYEFLYVRQEGKQLRSLVTSEKGLADLEGRGSKQNKSLSSYSRKTDTERENEVYEKVVKEKEGEGRKKEESVMNQSANER